MGSARSSNGGGSADRNNLQAKIVSVQKGVLCPVQQIDTVFWAVWCGCTNDALKSEQVSGSHQMQRPPHGPHG